MRWLTETAYIFTINEREILAKRCFNSCDLSYLEELLGILTLA